MVLQYVELAVVPTNSFVPLLRSMALIIGSGPTTRLSTSVLYDELGSPASVLDGRPRVRITVVVCQTK